MIRESRHVSRLLRLAATKEQWDKAIVQNNVLQKQTVSAAQRITRGLRRRLEKLEPDLLKAIELGDDELPVKPEARCNSEPCVADFF